MAHPAAQNNSAPNGISIGARAEIIPAISLHELNSPGAPAYGARIKGDVNADLMAILCNSGLQPRLDSIVSMKSVDHSSILRLIDSGVVQWPHDDMRYYAFAFQRPVAPRMTESLEQPHAQMSEDAVNHFFVTPMIGALAELARTGLVHNAIRPSNIFWRIGGSTPPQLGECLSAPPGYGQPALFETLERSMSMPLGRGVGSHADDSYAFGITLALLVLGHNPLQGMDDGAIMRLKLERGTFNTLLGTRRLAPSHIELLRGLLIDDARQRWTANDLEQWMNGRRLTPKNTDHGRRASRHIDFAGKEFWQSRPLAAELGVNVGQAAQMIERGDLNKWLRRSLGDEERADALEAAKTSLKQSGKSANYDDQLVARASVALDPTAPIRYRGLSVMPSGIADMLVEAVTTGNNLQALSEIISSQLVTFWVEMQRDVKAELLPLAQQYERVRGFMEKTNFGNGIERTVYELNGGLQCLSPMLRSQYVTNAKAVLPALERVASSGNRPQEPMDRHIAAFLVVRDRRSDSAFDAMASPPNSPRRALALLTLFSEIQSRHGPDTVPQLAQWFVPLLEPVIQRYLGKVMKEKLNAQLRTTAQAGNLAALLRLVDDPRRVEYDQQEFMAARMLYLNTLKEIAGLESKLADREAVIHHTGKPMAATFSSFIAILFVLVAIMRAIWQYIGF